MARKDREKDPAWEGHRQRFAEAWRAMEEEAEIAKRPLEKLVDPTELATQLEATIGEEARLIVHEALILGQMYGIEDEKRIDLATDGLDRAVRGRQLDLEAARRLVRHGVGRRIKREPVSAHARSALSETVPLTGSDWESLPEPVKEVAVIHGTLGEVGLWYLTDQDSLAALAALALPSYGQGEDHFQRWRRIVSVDTRRDVELAMVRTALRVRRGYDPPPPEPKALKDIWSPPMHLMAYSWACIEGQFPEGTTDLAVSHMVNAGEQLFDEYPNPTLEAAREGVNRIEGWDVVQQLQEVSFARRLLLGVVPPAG